MRKLFLLWALCLVTISVEAQTTSFQSDAKIASYINVDKPFDLLEKYKQYEHNLSPFISLVAQIDLAQHFNQEESGVNLIDSLLTQYPQNLTPETVWGYEHLKASFLFNTEQYQELYDFSIHIIAKYKNKENTNNTTRFSYYQNQCDFLKNIPSSEVVRPAKDCYVSTIQDRNQRIHIPVKVNGFLLPDCMVDTGAPLSLFQHSVVKNAGLKILGDTITAYSSTYGHIKLSLAIIDSLNIGGVSLNNIRVGIVCSGQKFLPEPGIIGIQELKRLKKIIITPKKLIFPYHVPKNSDIIPNMELKDNHPHIRIKHKEQEVELFFDTGSDLNYLSINSLLVDPTSTETTKELILTLNNSFPVTFAITTLNDLTSNLLGLPFTRSFKEVTMDFVNMQIQTDSFVNHTSPELYMRKEDYFGLAHWEENYNLDKTRKYLVKALSYSGKNQPKQTIAFIDTLTSDLPLEEKYNLFSMLICKAGALYDLGQYKQSCKVLEEASVLLPEVPAGLQQLINRNRATVECLPTKIQFTSPNKSIRLLKNKNNKLVIPLEINDTKEEAIINLGQNFCEISENYVAKLNVKIIADSIIRSDQVIKIGIVDQLKIGDVIAKNVIFYILPENESNITLGNSLFRLIPQISIKPNKNITLHEECVEQIYADSLPLRLQHYFLTTQLKLNDNPVIFEINNKLGVHIDDTFREKGQLYIGKNKVGSEEIEIENIPTSTLGIRGQIGFTDLLKENNEITFDFQNMKIYLN